MMAEGSHNALHVHAVWSTHRRQPLLVSQLDQELFRFIRLKLTQLNCMPRAVGGTDDHVHVLVSFRPALPIARLVAELKGASSHFANHELGLGGRFGWQAGYSAFTVSNVDLPAVGRYVTDQRAHHASGGTEPAWECLGDPG
jgi:putative transposase